jgi:hypothetical protein
MTTQDRTAMQTEALDRARTGQSLSNYPAIYAGFAEKGIAEAEIKPRENVFTFNAWKALGRSVKKGEHGVKVTTWINVKSGEESDDDDGDSYRVPKLSTVFHISQTELTSEREARLGAKWQSPEWRSRKLHRKRDDKPRDYVRDPGEDAADRWTETHY